MLRRPAPQGAIEAVASIDPPSLQLVTTDAQPSHPTPDGATRSDADTYRIQFAPEARS